MLNLADLEYILDEVRMRLITANRTGDLKDILVAAGWADLIDSPTQRFESSKLGKIVVLAGDRIKEKDIKGIFNELGINKDRLECCLDYDTLQKYPYSKLLYQPKYRVVLCGSMPHSTTGTGDSQSVISEMESNPNYPRVLRLLSGSELKATKTNVKECLEGLLTEGYILRDN